MTLDKFEVLLLTLAFVVPGFIIHSVFSMFTVRRNEATKEILFLRFLAFSALNVIVCTPLIFQIISKHWIIKHPWLMAFCMMGMTFISPLMLGLIIAVLDQKQVLRRLLGRIGLHPLHCTPTAWDYKFARFSAAGGGWIIVELKDSRKVRGLFGAKSFASTEPTERDLYLEQVWEVPADDTEAAWKKCEDTDGILIRHDDIRNVSFVPLTVPANDTPQTTLTNNEVPVPLLTETELTPQAKETKQCLMND